jgi:hypothetical protein
MKKNTHLILASLLFFWVIACTFQDGIITPSVYPLMSKIPSACPQALTTAVPMPKFLESVYPSGSITKEEYEKTLKSPAFKGIHIRVSADGIDSSVLKSIDADYRRHAISNRIHLLIDEILISNEMATVLDGLVDSGPFDLSWPVQLNTGSHKAKLIFDTDEAETVNYDWTFCILP